MNASKFADFFDFTIIRNDGCDKVNGLYRFEVVDNNGVFETRRILNVADLSMCFGACVQDYIFETLKYHGFDFDSLGIHYPAARDFIKNNESLKDSDLKDVVDCIINPHLIKDDVTDVESIRLNAKAVIVEFFAGLWNSSSYTLVYDIQHELNMDLADIVEAILKGCKADGEFSESDSELSIGAMESICELDAVLNQHTNYYEQTIETIRHLVDEAKKYEEVAA